MGRVISYTLRQQLLGSLQVQGATSEDAEDALQEAYMRLLVASPVFVVPVGTSEEEPMKAWLLVVASRYLIDRHRHESLFTCISLSEGTAGTAGQEALKALSEADRIVLALSAEGCRGKEIAEKLQIHEETAKKRLQRAREHFRDQLIHNGMERL